MGQKGEVVRAGRIMEPILSVDTFTYLIVGVFDKAVWFLRVKTKRRVKILHYIFFSTLKTYLGEQSNN